MNNFQDCGSNMIHFTIIMLALFPWPFSAQGKGIPTVYVTCKVVLICRTRNTEIFVFMYRTSVWIFFIVLYYCGSSLERHNNICGGLFVTNVHCMCWDTVHCTVAQQRVSEEARPSNKHRTCSTHAPPISYFHPWASPPYLAHSWDTPQPWATPHP